MSFADSIASGFRNYANFYDRASRSEFWYWYLFYFLVFIAAIIIDFAVFGARLPDLSGAYVPGAQPDFPVANLTSIALSLPILGIGVRRLHDIDRSGWWLLLSAVPIVGWIVLLVWQCTRGTPGPNRFGHDPLGEHRLDLAEKPISFTEAIASGFRNYVNFSDRAYGSEFWYWFLFAILFTGVAGLIDRLVFGEEGYPAISGLALLVIALPTLGIAVRRLHDIDRRGWWVLLILLPVIGWIILIVWYCRRAKPGPNRFGPDPLAEHEPARLPA